MSLPSAARGAGGQPDPTHDTLRLRDRLRDRIGTLLGHPTPAATAQAVLAAGGEQDAAAERVASLAAQLRANALDLGGALTRTLATPTAAQHHAPRMLWQLMGAPAACEIIGLGCHCFTASLLNRWGARRWSGPLDWTFSCAGMAAHCIDDDFETFLDRRHYAPVPPAERRDGPEFNRVQHLAYREMFGIEHVFNHHDAHLDEVHRYFVRCVQRLRDAFARPGPKLFLVTRAMGTGRKGELGTLYEALARRTTDFELMVVDVRSDGTAREHAPLLHTSRLADHLLYCTLDPVSAWMPLAFGDLLDEHALMRLVAAMCWRAARPAEAQAAPA